MIKSVWGELGGSTAAPLCSISKNTATSFCWTPGCTVGAFCCDSCSKQGCLRTHAHNNLKIAFIDDINPSFAKLMNEDFLSEQRELTLTEFTNQIKAIQQDLEEMVIKYRHTVQAKAKMVKYRPEIAGILRAISDRTTSSITGDQMGLFMRFHDSKDYFLGLAQYEQAMSRENDQFRILLDSIRDAMKRFRQNLSQDLNKSMIRADTFRKERKLADSIMEYSLVLEVDPKNAKCYHRQASSHYELSQHEEAIRCETEALKLQPNNFTYYNSRALNYYTMGKFKEALADFSQAIRLNPQLAMLYRNRGDCLKDYKQYSKALTDYNKAISLDPKNDAFYSCRADCHYRMRDFKSAVNDFSQAIRLKPTDHQYLRARGDTYYEMKQFELALSDYNKAIELSPTYSIALNNRGNTQFGLRNYQLAVRDYTQAIRLQPTNSMYHSHRAKAYKKLGQLEEASRDTQQAIQLSKSK